MRIGKARERGSGEARALGRQRAGGAARRPVRGVLCRVPASRRREKGFTLAALVVMMAVMAIFLTVAIETVTFQQRREKEEELIFRGNQIVEGIRIFRARFARFPVQLDELAKSKPRVLWKVWTDPMTGKADWSPVFLGEDGTTLNPVPNPQATPQATPQPTPQPNQLLPGGQGARGPIIGVKSRVCENSIKMYLGHTRYCEWKFFYDPSKLQLPGSPAAVPTPKP